MVHLFHPCPFNLSLSLYRLLAASHHHSQYWPHFGPWCMSSSLHKPIQTLSFLSSSPWPLLPGAISTPSSWSGPLGQGYPVNQVAIVGGHLRLGSSGIVHLFKRPHGFCFALFPFFFLLYLPCILHAAGNGGNGDDVAGISKVLLSYRTV